MDIASNGAPAALFDFDAAEASPGLIHIPVKYQGHSYVLVEALEDAVAQWRNAQLAGTRLQQADGSDVKTVALGGMADSQPLLVSLCLFKAGPQGELQLDPNGNVDTRFRVALQVVKKWPTRLVTPLFEWVMETSGLAKKETVESLDKQIADLQKRRDRLAKAADKQRAEMDEQELLGKN